MEQCEDRSYICSLVNVDFVLWFELNLETKIGNKILNTILMIAMHHAIKEVTVSHEGLNYLRDRQETINDTAL